MTASRRAHTCALTALCLAAALAAPVPAAATSVAAGVATGSGSLSPGLGALPSPQVISWSGSLTGAGAISGGAAMVSDACSFSGTSGPLGGTVAADLGTVSGSCTGSVAISAALTFARAGAVVGLEGSGAVGADAAVVSGICAFASTQLPPITSFSLDCAVSGV